MSPLSATTIGLALKRINFTRKKTYRYRERDEPLRSAFRVQIRKLALESFVYLDESGFQDTLDYPYSYCHRTERLSVIGAWRDGEVIAPAVLERLRQ